MEIKKLLRNTTSDDYGLNHLQNIVLNIMLYIDRLCEENCIEYYIIGGTALGAIRHGGFIPWDDDLDIAMTRENFNKFVNVCKSSSFDTNQFYFQQERVDWRYYSSKIRLLGTHFEEIGENDSIPYEKRGIFVDIFPLDNVPDSRLKQYWWYFCGKILVAYGQADNINYHPSGIVKKCAILFAKSLRISRIRCFFENQVEKYNKLNTLYIGGHSLVSRFGNTFTKKEIWGKATRIKFETISLLAPEDTEGFLRFYFGDYNRIPPMEERKSRHLIEVDYGIF